MAVATTSSDKVRMEMFLTREEDALFMVTVMGEFEKAHYLALAEVAGEQVINKPTRQYVDQCAVDFRYLCEQTSVIAQTHAKGFCDKAIRFFSHLDRLRKSRRIILQIAERAKEVSKGYVQIRDYSQSLSARMKTAKRRVARGSDGFEMKFESAHETADTMKKKAETREAEAQATFDKFDANRASYKRYGWIPLVGQLGMLLNEYGRLASSLRVNLTHYDTKIAAAKEEEALENLSEAQRLVKGAKQLEEFLEKVANMADLMALFWFVQSQKFSSSADKMGELDEAVGEGDAEDEFIAEEIVEELTEIRDQLLKYGMIAARACTTSNFDVGCLQATPMKAVTEEEFLRVGETFEVNFQ